MCCVLELDLFCMNESLCSVRNVLQILGGPCFPPKKSVSSEWSLVTTEIAEALSDPKECFTSHYHISQYEGEFKSVPGSNREIYLLTEDGSLITLSSLLLGNFE